MPLADLLSPMIARKALELQTQLPPAQGYLQAQQSMGANPGQVTQPANPAYRGGPSADEQAKVDAEYKKRLAAARAKEKTPGVKAAPDIGVEGTPESYDPRTQTDRYNAYVAGGQKIQKGDKKGSMQGLHEMFNAAHGDLMPMPNPGSAPVGEPVAFDERGNPIYMAPEPPMPLAGRHRNQMLLPPGDVAMRENGMPLDSRGRPTGYLNMLGARTPGAPSQFADRRPGDMSLDQMKLMAQKDPFARAQLDQMYGQHLHAKDSDERGFNGYLKTLRHTDGSPYSKEERDGIKAGVKVLRDVQNTEDRTTLTSI